MQQAYIKKNKKHYFNTIKKINIIYKAYVIKTKYIIFFSLNTNFI